MSDQANVNINQRLIGAIVLVSLGVILIPLLLNGGPDLKTSLSGTNIPVMPEKLKQAIPEIPKPAPEPASRAVTSYPVESLSVVDTMIKNNDSEPATTVAEEDTQQTSTKAQNFQKAQAPETTKIDTAYTLQVASFSKKDNAYSLRDQLRKNKYKAYIELTSTAKGKIYRLRIGPYLKYEQILSIQKSVEKQFKLSKTVIVNYKS